MSFSPPVQHVFDVCRTCLWNGVHSPDCPRLKLILRSTNRYHFLKYVDDSEKLSHFLRYQEREIMYYGVEDPMKLVPPEIATRIMLFYVECPALPEKSQWWSRRNAIRLAGVSRYWRELAFSEPHMWTAIAIQGKANTWNIPLTLVEEWISRSRQLPLTIQVLLTGDGPVSAHIIAAFKMLCECRSRWRYAILEVPVDFLLDLPRITLPPLENFQLEIYGRLDWDSNEPFNLTVYPTRLRSPSVDPTSMGIHLRNVTNFSIRLSATGPRLGNILRQCPNIEQLEAWIPEWLHSYIPESSEPIVLAHLHTVHVWIRDYNQNPFADTLTLVIAPNLAEICVRGMHKAGWIPLDDATSCLLRSGNSSLKRLELSSCEFSDRDLLPLLRAAPSLETLQLWGITDDSEREEALTDTLLRAFLEINASTGLPVLMPNLIKFDYTGFCFLDWNVVADVIEARLHHPHNSSPRPLRTFKLVSTNFEAIQDYMDRRSVERFFAFPRGAFGDYSLKLSSDLLERAMAKHEIPWPGHDVSLFYRLSYAEAFYCWTHWYAECRSYL